MTGLNAQYVEVRSGTVSDDGREIVMEGDNACYREVAGVGTVEKKTVVAEVEATATAGALPECLATERALGYWQRLREAGFVDKNCQLLDSTSRQQAWVIAEMFAEELKVDNMKWKLFQDLWNIKNLAQERNYSKASGLLPTRYKEICDVFNRRM